MENQKIDELNNALVNIVENDEHAADILANEFDIKEEHYDEINSTFGDFIGDYKTKEQSETDESFLVRKFTKYSNLWENDEELKNDAKDIVTTVNSYYESKNDLDKHCAQGRDIDTWLEKKISQGATAAGTAAVMQYGALLDTSISMANEAMSNMIHRLDGGIKQTNTLDGFIAEQHHVNTFNMDAAAKESGFYAETLQSTNKNSVDIVIKDSRGNIVRKYQSKYYQDSAATEKAFKEGDYSFQRKLVPEGQGKDISNANEKIEIRSSNKGSERIESTPLSKEDAKEIQRKAQEEGVVPEYDWFNFKTKDVAKAIGKRAAISAAFAVGLQGARIIGRRIINKLRGKENNPIKEDIKEFAKSSLESGATSGLTIAASGALTVITKRGFLGKVLKNTPAGRIAAAACIGIENIKTLYKFGKGEITGEQALDEAGRSTCSLIGSLAMAGKGASLGATLGTALGPIGTTIGGLVGGIVGGIAGGVVGEKIFSAGKKIVKFACNTVKKIGTTIVSGAKKIANAIKSVFA